MKAFYSASLVVAALVAPLEVASAQSGTETFPASGTLSGRTFNSITVNYDTKSITYNFTDGGQFTPSSVDPGVFEVLLTRLRANRKTG
ncbi:MAG TPA: hypothetical protein VF650_12040 [Allosphingosinicella sp.]|jgi:hypothetical protein